MENLSSIRNLKDSKRVGMLREMHENEEELYGIRIL